MEVKEVEFNADFITRMLERLEWGALVDAAGQLGVADGLPEMAPSSGKEEEDEEDVLRKIHHVLLEVEITEGELECPETGRKFPIKNGIPDMRLNEDE